MSFSILLHRLDPPPTRHQLEEISLQVPGISKVDCAGLLEHWHGIVVSNLEYSDAQAFHQVLCQAGFNNDIVMDADIPALHADFRCQKIELSENLITLTDAMNRARKKPLDELVFVAAGLLEKQKLATNFRIETEHRYSQYGVHNVQVEKRYKQEIDKIFFRIDLFFSNEPHRISLEIDSDSVMFYADLPIRLKDTLKLKILMTDLHLLLPPERMNTHMCERTLDQSFTSMNAYEEEIRWAFYRISANG